jgi:hypothetical protein
MNLAQLFLNLALLLLNLALLLMKLAPISLKISSSTETRPTSIKVIQTQPAFKSTLEKLQKLHSPSKKGTTQPPNNPKLPPTSSNIPK